MNKLALVSLLAVLPVAAFALGTTAFAGGGGGGMGGAGRRGPGGGGAALPTTHPADSPVVGAITKLPNTFKFTEGPTSDKDGNIYFVDQNSNAIHKYTFDKEAADPTKGTVSTFLTPSGYANGMCFDNDGNLITCSDEKNQLWSIAAPFPALPAGATSFKPTDLKITVVIKDVDLPNKIVNPPANGKLLNGPNDVFVVPDGPAKGGMYLTDPLWARQWWQGFRTNQSQMPGQQVYFLSPDRKTITPVITDFRGPNGVIGTPDGKTLYVSDMGGNQTFSYTIKPDGTLADKKPFCAAGSDGMTIDSDGNVYTTNGNAGQGVQIWSKDGKRLEQLPIASTNCCFGGPKGNVLFITAQASVYVVQMKTHKVVAQ